MLDKIKAINFSKWMVVETQLLDELYKRLPLSFIEKGEIQRYVEPFAGGGGAFFFFKKAAKN